MREVGEKGHKQAAGGDEPAGQARGVADDRMARALQLASSSPTHRAAYEADPHGYLQRLGVDTRGMAPAPRLKKLKFSKETIARLDGDGRRGFTMGDSLATIFNTVTQTATPPSLPTITLHTFTIPGGGGGGGGGGQQPAPPAPDPAPAPAPGTLITWAPSDYGITACGPGGGVTTVSVTA